MSESHRAALQRLIDIWQQEAATKKDMQLNALLTTTQRRIKNLS